MSSKQRYVFTNIDVFRAIADAAFMRMTDDGDLRSRPESVDSGHVKSFDPNQTSFKEALISVVFSSIWLEAALHLLIVETHGRERYEEVDRKSYEKKLGLLGCSDARLLKKVEQLREARKELVHEKAHLQTDKCGTFTGTIRIAQDEAKNGHEVVAEVCERFPKLLGREDITSS